MSPGIEYNDFPTLLGLQAYTYHTYGLRLPALIQIGCSQHCSHCLKCATSKMLSIEMILDFDQEIVKQGLCACFHLLCHGQEYIGIDAVSFELFRTVND